MSNPNIDKTVLNDVIQQAAKLAINYNHETFSKIHVLHVILCEPKMKELLQRSGVDLPKLEDLVAKKIKNLEVNKIPNTQPMQSQDIEQIFNISSQYGGIHHNFGVEVYDIIFAFLSLIKSEEYYFIMESGFNKAFFETELLSRRQYYNYYIPAETMGQASPANKKSGQANSNAQKPTFEQTLSEMSWLTDLTANLKKNTDTDPMIGRELEIEKLIHTISKKKKSNAILLGEPGVGKTAIVEGLAKRINSKSVPEEIQDHKVFILDISALIASSKYRGDLESRLQQTISLLKSRKNSILFVDEIHMLIGAGATGESSMDASNILKPALASGEIKIVGATTYKEFRNTFEKDQAFSRRFQKIDVEEPSIEDTVKILTGLKSGYESFHKVNYLPESIQLATELSVKYLKDKFLPDKAIDVLDESGTYVKFNRAASDGVVTPEVIRKVISKLARIPEESLNDSVKNQVQNLESNLKSVIFGQDEVINKVVDIVMVSKAGLGNQKKPVGSFMFAGPTGTGKTETTNQLAKFLSMPMTRLDMSEYKEEHSVAKLIGAPPGYVGFDQEGQLTGAVLRNPASIILLDEIEKAHPKVLDLLLQVLDYGTLKDSHGKAADFTQAIIIFTTNTGSEETTKSVIGLTENSIASQRDPMGVLKNSLRPEFLNRLDAMVWFNSLTPANIKQVLYKHVKELDQLLLAKNIKMSLTPEAESYLINKGYSPTLGARPMERVFQDEIKKPLAKEIMFGKLQNSGEVSVSLVDNKINFDIVVPKPKRVKKGVLNGETL